MITIIMLVMVLIIIAIIIMNGQKSIPATSSKGLKSRFTTANHM
jgi:preprotein translocase subunit SecG